MGKYSKFVMASVIGLTLQKLAAQNQFAALEKNYNVGAKDLSHELNTTKDTLLLNSSKTIDYVYAINSEYKREIDFHNDTNALKIPLHQLSKGKHLFVVVNSRKRIVFVVRVLKDAQAIALASEDKVTLSNN